MTQELLDKWADWYMCNTSCPLARALKAAGIENPRVCGDGTFYDSPVISNDCAIHHPEPGPGLAGYSGLFSKPQVLIPFELVYHLPEVPCLKK